MSPTGIHGYFGKVPDDPPSRRWIIKGAHWRGADYFSDTPLSCVFVSAGHVMQGPGYGLPSGEDEAD